MRYLQILAFLVLAATARAQDVDYAARLAGKRLVLKGASCAGWSFGSDGVVTRYDEIDCSHGGLDEATFDARVRWISRDSFILIESTRAKGSKCPPRTYLYTVQSIAGNKATVKSIWTDWGKYADSVEEYVLRTP